MIKQLRIGNLVEIENHTKVCEVIEIKEKSLRVSYIRSDNGMVHNPIIEIDRIKPIPLTEKILISLGGILDWEDDTYVFGNFAVSVNKKSEALMFLKNEQIAEFNYLHQFQNLFFALTNQELTFKSE
jgi:hypothetical protein